MERMIELGGRNFALRYTVNSMCAVEERAGRPLVEALEQEYCAARLLLWGGLIDGKPEMTLAGAGELLGAHLRGGGTLDAVVDSCAEAMREAGFFRRAARVEQTEDAACAKCMQR